MLCMSLPLTMSRRPSLQLLQASMYAQAGHCYEELLLHTPHSIPYHVQYADVLYTLGGSSYTTAQTYYAAAVKLSEGHSIRALYGLCACAAQLSSGKAGPSGAGLLPGLLPAWC